MYEYMYQTIWEDKIYFKRIQFENEDEAETWTAQMKYIKAMREKLLDDGGIEGLTDHEFYWRSNAWIDYCHTWIKTWGKDKIPQDIRKRIHETEKIVCFETTCFGYDHGAFYEPKIKNPYKKKTTVVSEIHRAGWDHNAMADLNAYIIKK